MKVVREGGGGVVYTWDADKCVRHGFDTAAVLMSESRLTSAILLSTCAAPSMQ